MPMYVSTFIPDRRRQAEFFVGLWHGERPKSITLHQWLRVPGDAARFLLIWEGDDAAGQWVEQNWAEFGELQTEPATTLTDGMAACFAHDLDSFRHSLAAHGLTPIAIERAVELRRRAMEAPSREAALATARSWEAEDPAQ
jgi:hypothetical protein